MGKDKQHYYLNSIKPELFIRKQWNCWNNEFIKVNPDIVEHQNGEMKYNQFGSESQSFMNFDKSQMHILG